MRHSINFEDIPCFPGSDSTITLNLQIINTDDHDCVKGLPKDIACQYSAVSVSILTRVHCGSIYCSQFVDDNAYHVEVGTHRATAI